jgi:ketosteroid isomerase-like protein
METKVLGTREVLDHHVQALGRGDVDAILDDYTEESVLMVQEAALKGLVAIRAAFVAYLDGLLKPGTYELTMDSVRIDGEVAHAIWHAQCVGADIAFATDTFVVKGGKIALQTFAGKVVPH